MVTLTINGETREIDVPVEMPLLWVLRDGLGLTGSKYGCGVGLCGACTVHLDGEATPSCQVPVGEVAGRAVTTIEALAAGGEHPVPRAWLAEQVPQCGWCQSGQIMAAAALLAANPAPSEEEVDAAMRRVLCRCGTYPRVRRAIARAAAEASG